MHVGILPNVRPPHTQMATRPLHHRYKSRDGFQTHALRQFREHPHLVPRLQPVQLRKMGEQHKSLPRQYVYREFSLTNVFLSLRCVFFFFKSITRPEKSRKVHRLQENAVLKILQCGGKSVMLIRVLGAIVTTTNISTITATHPVYS